MAGRSRFVTGAVRVSNGAGRAEVVPETAGAAPLPAAVGREAACCRPWHLAVAEDGRLRRRSVRGGDGRQPEMFQDATALVPRIV